MAAADLPDWFQSLLAAAHLPTRLSHYRISAADLPALAEGACQQWTAGFNPVPVDAAVFEKLYAAAL
jgi:alcohol dehydrogenase class IV